MPHGCLRRARAGGPPQPAGERALGQQVDGGFQQRNGGDRRREQQAEQSVEEHLVVQCPALRQQRLDQGAARPCDRQEQQRARQPVRVER